MEVVREAGYAHATTRVIAQRAGVAEGTIYRHFPDKAALCFAAVLESDAAVLTTLSELANLAGSRTVEANLTEALLRLASLRAELLPLELALLTDPELAGRRRQAAEVLDGGKLLGPPQLIAEYLAAEQRLGRVRADVPAERMAIVLLAMLFGMAIVSIDDARVERPGELAGAVALVLSGMEARNGRRPARLQPR